MGERVKPAFTSEFEMVPEGLYIFRTEKADVNKSDKSVKHFSIRSLVEGGEEDGVSILDGLPLVSEKNFGAARLLGFLIKLDIIDPKKFLDAEGTCDIELFASEKFEEKFKVAVPGKVFGGKVKHRTYEDKGITKTVANIVEYYTVDEVKEKMKLQAEKGKSSGSEGKVKRESKKTEPVKEPEKTEEFEWK